ncbi:MAG: polyprenyl synthetase family protein, partial [Proteobacteria bacterium]|nr:polyprenyl synthetase family protein [Pseudomonadota bacterium]
MSGTSPSPPPTPPPALADMLGASEAVIKTAIGVGENMGGGTGGGGNQQLQDGMAYAVLGGGKRIRSQLILATTAMLDASYTKFATRVAASYECLHAYSLVHDDLPAMDDAQTRRGKPACHIAFDEATAILIGDALQTLAFQILADPMTHPDAEVRSRLILDLTTAAGVDGMAGGQMLDMLAVDNDFDLATTRKLQAMKTGALMTAAMRAGGHITASDDETMGGLSGVGEAIGA